MHCVCRASLSARAWQAGQSVIRLSKLVCRPVVAVLSGDVAKVSEGFDVMDIVLSALALGGAALPTSVFVTHERRQAMPSTNRGRSR